MNYITFGKGNKMQNNEKYLNELKKAREKYMVSDFPKYLKECNKIDEKYLNHNICSLYPSINKGDENK
jgi:hypothetical protein